MTTPVGLVSTLTEEQAMLVDASVRFMESEMPVAAVRARVDEAAPDDAAYRAAAAEFGWFGFLGGEDAGGGSLSGNAVVDAAVLAAELGARLQPGPYAGHSVVVDALTRVGGPAHAAVLADLVSGAAWATWAFGDDAACMLGLAADGVRLDGRIDLVAEAASCSHVLVGASGPDGFTQVLVPLDAAGVTVRPLESFDVSRRFSAIDLQGVTLPADAVVGEPGGGTAVQLMRQVHLAAVLSAADAVGAMHTDFEIALQYAKDRIAFGRPIGSFQALKHMIADVSLAVEMSKGIVAEAARALGEDADDAAELVHAAKSFVGEHSVDVMHRCFQVFGGIGFTWEHDQHLYLRRMSADAVMFGSPAWHREQLVVTTEAVR
ncbi:MAG: acyl-CoA dehydrogenase [Acidimicrobiia bacterium]